MPGFRHVRWWALNFEIFLLFTFFRRFNDFLLKNQLEGRGFNGKGLHWKFQSGTVEHNREIVPRVLSPQFHPYLFLGAHGK